jgi:hypothetical protein
LNRNHPPDGPLDKQSVMSILNSLNCGSWMLEPAGYMQKIRSLAGILTAKLFAVYVLFLYITQRSSLL